MVIADTAKAIIQVELPILVRFDQILYAIDFVVLFRSSYIALFDFTVVVVKIVRLKLLSGRIF